MSKGLRPQPIHPGIPTLVQGRSARKHQRGLTLIQFMLGLLVLGIVLSIAVRAYQRYRAEPPRAESARDYQIGPLNG